MREIKNRALIPLDLVFVIILSRFFVENSDFSAGNGDRWWG